MYLSKNTLANIKADGRSRIEGTELTSIKTKTLDNTALIGNKGRTYIEADSIVNRSIGNQIAEIKGDKTSLIADSDIFNIGSKISATDELNLIAKNGNILNKSTVIETNYDFGDLNRTRHNELENISEISSNNAKSGGATDKQIQQKILNALAFLEQLTIEQNEILVVKELVAKQVKEVERQKEEQKRQEEAKKFKEAEDEGAKKVNTEMLKIGSEGKK